MLGYILNFAMRGSSLVTWEIQRPTVWVLIKKQAFLNLHLATHIYKKRELLSFERGWKYQKRGQKRFLEVENFYLLLYNNLEIIAHGHRGKHSSGARRTNHDPDRWSLRARIRPGSPRKTCGRTHHQKKVILHLWLQACSLRNSGCRRAGDLITQDFKQIHLNLRRIRSPCPPLFLFEDPLPEELLWVFQERGDLQQRMRVRGMRKQGKTVSF